jgi:hypothetical protein
VKTAQAKLTALQDGTIQSQRQAAQSNLIAARQRLQSDQAKLEELLQTPRDTDIAQARGGRPSSSASAGAGGRRTPSRISAPSKRPSTRRSRAVEAQNPYTGTTSNRSSGGSTTANLHARQNPYSGGRRQTAQDYAQAAAWRSTSGAVAIEDHGTCRRSGVRNSWRCIRESDHVGHPGPRPVLANARTARQASTPASK